MPLEERFISVLYRTLPKLPADIQDAFAAMLSPTTLAVIVGVLAVWAGSHYVGIGFIVDVVFVVGGVILVGWEIWSAAADFMAFLDLTYNGRTENDLERAASHLSKFIAVVGIEVFLAMLTRGAGKKINVKAANARAVTRTAVAADAGMTAAHFRAIRQLAMSPTNPRVILFRKTNLGHPSKTGGANYIELGFPPKPKEIKGANTLDSGIVTCNKGKVDSVRKIVEPDSGKKYYTVDRNGRTATNGDGHTIDLSGKSWSRILEPDQVIHPQKEMPVVGDYDLFDVIDPRVFDGTMPPNQGNMVLASSDGKFVDDFTNPWKRQAVADINNALGSRQVMHGHHGAFDSIANLDPTEAVTAFFPDGSTVVYNRAALQNLYDRLGRSTLDLKQFMP